MRLSQLWKIGLIAAPLMTAGADYEVSSYAIGGGNGYSFGGAYDLHSTIGQADVGAPLTGGGFSLTGGFQAVAVPPVTCVGDSDGDLDVDLSDLAQALSEFGRSGSALAADFDGDQDVDLSDLALLLAQFGQACA